MRQITMLWKMRMLVRHPVRTVRALFDRETPLSSKALPPLSIIYAAVPLDFLPDIFPILGQFDDVAIVILLTGYALSRVPDEAYRRAGLDPEKMKIDYHSELP